MTITKPQQHRGDALSINSSTRTERQWLLTDHHFIGIRCIDVNIDQTAFGNGDLPALALEGKYATFFRHYHDKDELLKDVLDVVLTELISLLYPALPDADPATIGVLLFRYVATHSEVGHVLLRRHVLLQRIIEIATQNRANDHTPLPDSAVPLEIAAHHIVTSSISLIQWWLDHHMPYPPEHMGVIYHALIIHPTSAVAFSS